MTVILLTSVKRTKEDILDNFLSGMEEISHEKQLSSRHTHHRAAQTLPMRRGTEVAVLYKPERKEVKWIEEMEGRSRVAPALSRSEEECGGGGEGRKMDGGKGHSHLYQ